MSPIFITRRNTAFLAAAVSVLLIAGCSDNKSTTGVSLSKEASSCYSEYVDLHGDIKKAYKAQVSTGIASQSEYGKAHYEGSGAGEGRALPAGCAEHLQISTSCYASYVDQNPDLLTAWQASGQDKSAWGKWHFENRPATDTRSLPSTGCSYVFVPQPDDPSASYTDAQMLAYMNCYDDLKNKCSSDAAKIAYARKHYRLYGQAEKRTCGLVAEESSSVSGGGSGISVKVARK